MCGRRAGVVVCGRVNMCGGIVVQISALFCRGTIK
jgi:hypothetical protein